MQKNLLEALAIDAETTSVIAVVGGGGKTSLVDGRICCRWKKGDRDNDHTYGL